MAKAKCDRWHGLFETKYTAAVASMEDEDPETGKRHRKPKRIEWEDAGTLLVVAESVEDAAEKARHRVQAIDHCDDVSCKVRVHSCALVGEIDVL